MKWLLKIFTGDLLLTWLAYTVGIMAIALVLTVAVYRILQNYLPEMPPVLSSVLSYMPTNWGVIVGAMMAIKFALFIYKIQSNALKASVS